MSKPEVNFVGRQYIKVDPATLKPAGEIAEAAKIGDIVQVKLTLIAPTDLHYLLLEDALPAGFEAIDTSLKTSTAAAQGPQIQQQKRGTPDSQAPKVEEP